MVDVLFYYGTKAKYDALTTKDPGTLYFTTDTLQLFKGEEEYTKTVKLVSDLPATGQLQGVVYVKTTDFTAHVWDGTSFHQISQKTVTAIPSTGATDDTVPTTKAVADYVAAKLGDTSNLTGVVTSVTYTPSTGTMAVEKDGSTTNTVLTGVINNPTYEAATRKITLPVFGGDALVIELGKDAVVSSGSYNVSNKTIDLVLTSGDPISIPVESLIDIYTGLATSTATVTVSSDNKISVNVKVSATANNRITVEEDGLYVPDAYTKAETDAKVKAVQDALDEHKADAVAHITAEERTAWNAKPTQQDLATAKQAAIDAAAADATSKANQALADAKEYADGLNTAMDTRMDAVEVALTWKAL